jgi:hypothetical protein
MQEWISGVSAIGGGVVVGVSNYVVQHVQARSARKAELQAVFASFLHAVDLLVAQLRREPKPGRLAKRLNEALARRAPSVDYATGQLHQRLFAPHLQELIDRFYAAGDRLFLIAPAETLVPFEDIFDLLARAEARDEEWDRQWDAARMRLILSCRRALGTKTPKTAASRQKRADTATRQRQGTRDGQRRSRSRRTVA